VPEFDMPHRFYVNQLHEMTKIAGQENEEELKFDEEETVVQQ